MKYQPQEYTASIDKAFYDFAVTKYGTLNYYAFGGECMVRHQARVCRIMPDMSNVIDPAVVEQAWGLLHQAFDNFVAMYPEGTTSSPIVSLLDYNGKTEVSIALTTSYDHAMIYNSPSGVFRGLKSPVLLAEEIKSVCRLKLIPDVQDIIDMYMLLELLPSEQEIDLMCSMLDLEQLGNRTIFDLRKSHIKNQISDIGYDGEEIYNLCAEFFDGLHQKLAGKDGFWDGSHWYELRPYHQMSGKHRQERRYTLLQNLGIDPRKPYYDETPSERSRPETRNNW